jgi:hypothetical protein
MDRVFALAHNTLSRLCCALDARDYETLARCFAPDGIWLRQGKTLNGGDQIRQVLSQTRPATLTTLHVVANVCIDDHSEKTASGRFYLTVYRHDSGVAATGPFPVPSPSAAGLCKAVFTLIDNRWLLQRLETGPYVFAN